MSSQQKNNTPFLISYVKVNGNHREIGRQIGESCRDQVQHSVENARKLVANAFEQLQLDWVGAQIQARKYIPFAEENYPRYIEELKGISEGANVTFDDIAVVNAMEAVTTDALHLKKCTSIAVNQERTSENKVLIAHNEDWIPEDEPDVFIIQAHPDDEPPFLAMTYGCLLPNIGLNAFGISQCCDSVYPADSRIGIPRVINSRAVLAVKTIGEAIRHMVAPHRAAGYNHLLAHESGELFNIEVSSRKFAVLSAENGFIAHTNHYIDPQMQTIESEPDELISTRVRYFRAMRLLTQCKKHNNETLAMVLKDHINYPDSICNHSVEGDPLEREKTIVAIIMDLIERRMYVSPGNPCESSGYSCFELDC